MRALNAIESGLLRLQWLAAAAKFEVAMRRHELSLKYGYDPNQLRNELGRWTDAGALGSERIRFADAGVGRSTPDARPESDNGSGTLSKEALTNQIRRLFAAGPNTYQRCLDLCYPILERFQSPGVDYNKWDFHRCMDACLRGK
jgi:hypothetical protein